MPRINRASWWCVVAVFAALSVGCGSKSSGSKGNASSSSNAAVGKGSASTPSGNGGGASVNGGNDSPTNSGCVEDDSLDCSDSTGITCWGNVYPDPNDWNCSDGVTEDPAGAYTGYCCD